jgi:phage/plasmid-associated DNA primase
LLNVANGTLDPRTGELREHRREGLITKLARYITLEHIT